MLTSMTMHADQLDVPVETVRRLIAHQFPRWAALPVRPLESSGTVNALFRIGDHLTGRFPLQPIEVAAARRWLEEEAQAAPRAGRAHGVRDPRARRHRGAGPGLPAAVVGPDLGAGHPGG